MTQAKRVLTDRAIRTLKSPGPGKRSLVWDALVPGLGVRVTDKGVRTFVLVTRYPGSTSPAPRSLGAYGVISLEDARTKARAWLKLIGAGIDPKVEEQKAGEDTVQAICEEYHKREGSKLRSAALRHAALVRLVYPDLGRRQIDQVRRSDIVRLLDKIEIERGPVMADRILALIRKIMNWHATRSDEFRSPIVRGMARTNPKDRARERTLSDDELRLIWQAAVDGVFGAFVKFLLLTATRRNEAARAKHAEIVGVDWTIPAARYKTETDHVVPLSAASRAVLAGLPHTCDFIFSTNDKGPISRFSEFKRDFDNASGVTGWTLHDLRRTARSLMSRAGVPSDHAERALGHTMAGVRGTYDRHEYLEEKRQAFEALAGQIERIIAPQDNVVPIGRGR